MKQKGHVSYYNHRTSHLLQVCRSIPTRHEDRQRDVVTAGAGGPNADPNTMLDTTALPLLRNPVGSSHNQIGEGRMQCQPVRLTPAGLAEQAGWHVGRAEPVLPFQITVALIWPYLSPFAPQLWWTGCSFRAPATSAARCTPAWCSLGTSAAASPRGPMALSPGTRRTSSRGCRSVCRPRVCGRSVNMAFKTCLYQLPAHLVSD